MQLLCRLRDKLWIEEGKHSHYEENLINYIYANRIGNGDELSGGDYKYLGRDMILLTGKDEYISFSKKHNQMN